MEDFPGQLDTQRRMLDAMSSDVNKPDNTLTVEPVENGFLISFNGKLYIAVDIRDIQDLVSKLYDRVSF